MKKTKCAPERNLALAAVLASILSLVPGDGLAVTLEEALDATNLTWTTGGYDSWSGTTGITYDGMDAAESGYVSSDQETWIQTSVARLMVNLPGTRYVNAANSAPTWPYLNWADAATNIQDAIDAALAGDAVLVTNGTYNTGGRAIYGTMTNRVAIDKAITVQSVGGPEVTLIVGRGAGSGTNGDGAIRCVYVGTNAVLSGFTLTNGHTRARGDNRNEQSGGGEHGAKPVV